MHGYLSSKEAFCRQVDYFSRFFRVTAIDFIGFGESGALPSAYSVKEYAEWLYEIMQRLEVKNPHVIAHSFGCRVAVKLASEHNAVFDKILLTGPAGVILNRGAKYHCKVWAYRFVKRFAPRFAERHFGSAEYRTLSPIMKESYKKIVNEDLRACAKKVVNPVLLLVGEEDKTTPIKEAEEYLKCFQNGGLKSMKGGHFAFVDNPVIFNLIAEEFFYV